MRFFVAICALVSSLVFAQLNDNLDSEDLKSNLRAFDGSRQFQDMCEDNAGQWKDRGCFVSIAGRRACSCRGWQYCSSSDESFRTGSVGSIIFTERNPIGGCECCAGWVHFLVAIILVFICFACLTWCLNCVPRPYFPDSAVPIRTLVLNPRAYKHPVLGQYTPVAREDDVSAAALAISSPPIGRSLHGPGPAIAGGREVVVRHVHQRAAPVGQHFHNAEHRFNPHEHRATFSPSGDLVSSSPMEVRGPRGGVVVRDGGVGEEHEMVGYDVGPGASHAAGSGVIPPPLEGSGGYDIGIGGGAPAPPTAVNDRSRGYLASVEDQFALPATMASPSHDLRVPALTSIPLSPDGSMSPVPLLSRG